MGDEEMILLPFFVTISVFDFLRLIISYSSEILNPSVCVPQWLDYLVLCCISWLRSNSASPSGVSLWLAQGIPIDLI